jgi:hypothetical protein
MIPDILAQIDAPSPKGFCCGIVLRGDVVTRTAPIVKFMRSWTRARVRDYCRKRGWSVVAVTRSPKVAGWRAISFEVEKPAK